MFTELALARQSLDEPGNDETPAFCRESRRHARWRTVRSSLHDGLARSRPVGRRTGHRLWSASQESHPKEQTQMAYSLYDAAVTPCAQQLGALAGIIDKAAAHCAANKIEESALLQDRLYPDMFCLARQIRQSADLAMNTGGRLAGVTLPALPAVDDTSFAAAKSRVETALAFVKSLTRAQVDGAEGKVIAWTAGGNDRKMKGNDYAAAVRPAEFLLLRDDGVRHPAPS